ncbi:uncharacterized protein N7482_005525 [Penicillium canariense]|uniref:5-Methylcytosine G/T mismatch-specific DNA glycosylase n=1 Tax=Penicillium canariense TaxID=189055 RepID=A0A9W9I4Z5_9EURO|nr:uncharacterized protein N7482_005525 [Penicillium canariense]KAJ5166744.1 hypothetical protein N7482_005525 [Penicillium canariense]
MFFPVRPNSVKSRKPKSSSTSNNKHQQQPAKRSSQGRTSRTSTKETEPEESTARSSTSSTSHSAPPRRSSMPGLDAASRLGTASFLESRSSLPYPTFSKAHSKEDVRHRDIPTPDPTDLTDHKDNGEANGTSHNRTENHHAPPSPPLTGLDQESSQRGTAVGREDDKESEKPKTKKTNIKIRTEINRSSSSLRSKKDESTKSSKTARADTPKSKSSKTEKEASSPRASHKPSKTKLSDEKKLPKRSSRSTMSPSQSTVRDAGAESAPGSDVTSIAPNQQYTASRKPMTPPIKPPSRNQTRSAASHRRTPSDDSLDYGRPVMPGQGFDAPPPPPPPPEVPVSIPRVDYLLQHGGLDHRVPRTLLTGPATSDPFSQSATQPQLAAAKVFDPFNNLLDNYQKVMSKSGSLAVATGYRSVARRLLDRLEAVFARDISSEPCNCLMCEREAMENRPEGVSWGEVLELVSGRRELPMWPPFMMVASTVEARVPGEEHIPMQKLDVDVPEEYRDHFIRQSRKTKVAVDKWLSEQTDSASSAPEEVDDETLTFAMLTHLESHHRSLFCALLGINSSTPVPRSGEEKPRQRPSPLISSSLAIQRLYRLPSLPRDPETAMFMLNNPGLHHVLATLAAITDDEWEILISGRFDGFLRSGVEDAMTPTHPRRSGSCSTTPFSTGGISRGPTPNYMDGSFRPASQPNGAPSSPASFGGPIALDEETEIAALAEIERDIFLGMEALEDAFEALHLKAEVVRRALRERGAGLSVANQSRRGSYVEARLGTPASGVHAWESGTEDDFLDDDRSLAPDDSASNISSNRRRRPKRRTERRTPAPVEEEDEEEAPVQSSRRDSRNLRRR